VTPQRRESATFFSATVKEAVAEAEVKVPEEETAQTNPGVARFEQAKGAVLNSLTSTSGQRTYDQAITEFVAWYCSEPAWSPTAPYCSVSGSMSNSDTVRRPRSTCG
jgi:hypothetical protein